MVEIEYSRTGTGNVLANVFMWSSMTPGDAGRPMPFSMYADRSIQTLGTFGVSGSVVIEGSNDGENWATLTDLHGNALVLQSAKIVMVSEITQFLRPRVASGDGTTSITVLLMAKGT